MSGGAFKRALAKYIINNLILYHNTHH